MNGGELIEEARRLAEEKETPDRVSNRLLWALSVDAFHERKGLSKRLVKVEIAYIRRAALWGALGGVVAGVGTAIAAVLAVVR